MGIVRNTSEIFNAHDVGTTDDFVLDRMRGVVNTGSGLQDRAAGNIRNVTATGTGLPSDGTITFGGTGTYTFNLPTAAGLKGVIMRFKKTGASGVVTLDPAGAETIDAASTLAITAQWRIVEIQSDGTNWMLLSDHTPAAG